MSETYGDVRNRQEWQKRAWPIAGAAILIVLAFMVGRRTASPDVSYTIDYDNLDARVAEIEQWHKTLKQAGPPKQQRIRLFGSIKRQYTNVRAKPSTDAAIVKSLDKGTLVEINGSDGEWYRVTDGYIHRSLVGVD